MQSNITETTMAPSSTHVNKCCKEPGFPPRHTSAVRSLCQVYRSLASHVTYKEPEKRQVETRAGVLISIPAYIPIALVLVIPLSLRTGVTKLLAFLTTMVALLLISRYLEFNCFVSCF